MNLCYINKPVMSFVFLATFPSIPHIRWGFRVRGSALFSMFDAYSPNRTVGEGCVCVSGQQKVNEPLLSARYCAKSLTCIGSFHWSSCQFYELGTTFLPILQMRTWWHWALEGHHGWPGTGLGSAAWWSGSRTRTLPLHHHTAPWSQDPDPKFYG